MNSSNYLPDTQIVTTIKNGVNDTLQILNRQLESYDPVVLITVSVLGTHLTHKLFQRIPNDGVSEGLKRQFFRIIKCIPAVRAKIDTELRKAEDQLEDDVASMYLGENRSLSCLSQLPQKRLTNQQVIERIQGYMKLGSFNWENGQCSGAVYHGGQELTDLFAKVFEITMWSNALHMNVFPGVCRMEAEIVRMSVKLFNGGPKVCGSLTAGGTESLLMAVKVYRDWARDTKGILYPEILIPQTAHPAFDKAAQILNIPVRKVPINPDTFAVDIKLMKKMITGNTCMLVASAPTYPHGIIDDVEKVAQLGLKYGIPVHVDSCLGGFLLPFMDKAGFPMPLFDFRVPGVTSISADTHKYGNATKGSSILLFSDVKYKHYQYFAETNWSGGIYASPGLAGSRSGASIANCWAGIMSLGLEGFVENTRKIMETARYILDGTRNIKGVKVMGSPKTSVISWSSDTFDIYRLQDSMKKKGWQMTALQFPPGIHFCVAYCQTQDGVREKFVKDFRKSVEIIMQDPKAPAQGMAAIYGTTQQVPDRSIVSEITATFLDKLYLTEFKNKRDEEINN